MLNIEKLNNQFEIANQLRVVEGAGGFAMVEVNNEHATALISTYSGHVLAYHSKGEAEPLLFLSEQAEYTQGKAIRGGVPVCWPWFSDEGVPAHGFVRNQQWDIVSTLQLDDGTTKLVLAIEDNEHSESLWNHKFKLQLEVIIGKSLTMTLTTFNLDKDDFTISQALHTYLAVADVNQIEVSGLDGFHYLDKLNGFDKSYQSGELHIDGELDRIYGSLENNIILNDPTWKRKIRISSPGSNTAVIWNPGAEKAASMADLGKDDYKQFICIEAANTACDKTTVPAGGSSCLTVDYAIEH